VFVLVGCGGSLATAAKSSPTPSPLPSPTPDVGKLYNAAINKKFKAISRDFPALARTTPGSPEESAEFRHLSEDYQAFLDDLDKIPFPPDAKDDLSALKKTSVALQYFWTSAALDSRSFSWIVYKSLNDANNQAEILLGRDVGLSLTPTTLPSPTP
jgi:hypothetical protein